jgi:MATE family multidrug resistance protein
MLIAASLFVLIPQQFLSIFSGPEDFDKVMTIGVVLLRFVALYCVLDGLNIIFLGALQGAGDTRWTLFASVVLHLIFVAVLVTLEQLQMDLYAFWGAATAFVMLQAFVWMARFKSGAWKKMQVIEAIEP